MAVAELPQVAEPEPRQAQALLLAVEAAQAWVEPEVEAAAAQPLPWLQSQPEETRRCPAFLAIHLEPTFVREALEVLLLASGLLEDLQVAFLACPLRAGVAAVARPHLKMEWAALLAAVAELLAELAWELGLERQTESRSPAGSTTEAWLATPSFLTSSIVSFRSKLLA